MFSGAKAGLILNVIPPLPTKIQVPPTRVRVPKPNPVTQFGSHQPSIAAAGSFPDAILKNLRRFLDFIDPDLSVGAFIELWKTFAIIIQVPNEIYCSNA
jgi:hypothetical protein